MHKEYGGCLPLEIKKINNDLFSGFDSVALNSGRSAIAYGALEGGFDTCYIPYYTCKTVETGLQEAGISVQHYNIDKDFMPIVSDKGFDERALFVYTNYFGIMSKAKSSQIMAEHKNVLFDNTQGFFTKPVKGVYNAYSCRKFFGVPDGAYLVKDTLKRLDLPTSGSADYASFLLKAVEMGPNEAYNQSKENEEHINYDGMKYMSPLTSALMSGIDLDYVNARRTANFNRLHDLLGQINELEITLDNGAPMVYPLLINKEGVRETLVENNIFVPRWWRFIEQSDSTNDFEKHLSRHLVPIPITQTYDTDDMTYIANKVLEIISEK